MNDLVPVITGLVAGLVGLCIGLGVGISIRSRRAASDPLDVDRTRDIANAALADTMQRLLEVNNRLQEEAIARAAADATRQERTVHDLVDPVDRQLKALNETLGRIEQHRTADSSALLTTLRQLGGVTTSLQRETQTLATAMKDNKARGTWGEMQLQRVVELAGMVEHCDFVTQQTVAGDDGRLRPDLVVKLPQAKAIVVDSKVPMSAYLDAVSSEDPVARQALLDQHTRDIISHVNELERRDYSAYVDGALDFVVMFVPGDTFLSAAFESKPSFFDDAISRGVFPASPGTLIALLRAISYGWRQERLAENAEEIARLGRELHNRVATFAENFAKVGSALTTATRTYNDAVGSLEQRVLVTTRRFEEQGVRSGKEIPDLSPVEGTTRTLSAPELQPSPAHEA